jgi:AraC family transcriptional regulator
MQFGLLFVFVVTAHKIHRRLVPHREHVSKLRYTVNTIWSQWFPESGYKAARAAAGAPDFFERYGDGFDPQLGMGDVEVWIPVIE